MADNSVVGGLLALKKRKPARKLSGLFALWGSAAGSAPVS